MSVGGLKHNTIWSTLQPSLYIPPPLLPLPFPHLCCPPPHLCCPPPTPLQSSVSSCCPPPHLCGPQCPPAVPPPHLCSPQCPPAVPRPGGRRARLRLAVPLLPLVPLLELDVGELRRPGPCHRHSGTQLPGHGCGVGREEEGSSVAGQALAGGNLQRSQTNGGWGAAQAKRGPIDLAQ